MWNTFARKALGTNSSLSLLLGFSPHTFADSTNQQRLGDIIRRYEELRLNHAVPKTIREQLAQPGKAFTLEGDLANGWALRPVQFARHDITLENGRDTWTIQNDFSAQTPKIRIETLLSAEQYDSAESFVIEDFSDRSVYGDVTTQQGVSAEFSVVTESCQGRRDPWQCCPR